MSQGKKLEKLNIRNMVESFERGTEKGFALGQIEGVENGLERGFETGFKAGYEAGFREAMRKMQETTRNQEWQAIEATLNFTDDEIAALLTL